MHRTVSMEMEFTASNYIKIHQFVYIWFVTRLSKNQSHWMAHNVIIHLKCTKCVCNGSWLRWILYNFDVVNYVEWPWTRHSSKYISSSSKNRLKWMQVFTLKSRRLTPSPLSPSYFTLSRVTEHRHYHSLIKKTKNKKTETIITNRWH